MYFFLYIKKLLNRLQFYILYGWFERNINQYNFNLVKYQIITSDNLYVLTVF